MNPKLKTLYFVSFFLSIQYAFTAYINSTFLGNFLPALEIGLIYSLSALLAILWLAQIPKITGLFGNFKTYLALALGSIGTLFGIAFFSHDRIAVIFFVLYLILNYLLMFSRDIFIENYSEDKSTGRIRGMLLTVVNIGWVFAPLASSLLIGYAGFGSVYLLAALFSLPTIFLIIRRFSDFQDPIYEKISVWSAVKKIFQSRNLRWIYLSSFLLQLFYAWMIIYTPIYLSQNLNFSWETIGGIFVAMLIPFVLLEIPLGKLSDKIGEKEMLYIGFAVMGLSTLALSFLESNILMWAVLLFMTRVGAATVEVMTETYFFKKIAVTESETIGLFRNTAPLAFILAPILATFLLSFVGLKYIFLASGLTVLLGILFTYQIRDTA